MINRLYSKLVGGVNHEMPHYQREVYEQPAIDVTSRPDIGQLLVPGNPDKAYMNYSAEQLVQLCRKSILRDELTRIDPVNTYESEFSGAPENLTSITGVPATLEAVLTESTVFHNWIKRVFKVEVNPVTSKAYVNNVEQDFIWSSDISEPIVLVEGMGVVLRGTLPGAVFIFNVDTTRRPHYDLTAVGGRIQNVQMAWNEPYKEYQKAKEMDTQLAAFVLNYCEFH